MEKYYQSTGAPLHYAIVLHTKRGDWQCLSVAFDKPVYGEGKYYQLPRAPCYIDINLKTFSR